MKSTTDIKEIRRLLDRFYQGLTTLDEQATLCAYFEGEVAPELADDAEVFATLSALAPADVDVPDGLEDTLSAMTAPVAPEHNSFGLKKWIYAAVGAAAVLLAGVLLIKGVTSADHRSETPELPLLADATVIIAEPLPVDTGLAVVQVPDVKPSKKPAPVEVDAPQVADNPDNDDYYREVTDPAEAAKIMEEISILLARTLTEGNSAVSTMNMAFDRTAEQYNSITQKLLQ